MKTQDTKIYGTQQKQCWGKFIPINACIKNQWWSQVNNLTLQFKELEKEQQAKFKASRRKEIIKIRTEIKYGIWK